MTCEEFSREFDILYNNITSNQAPGLNEYEKSVFLTQAQESIILEMYSEKFESTEDVTSYLNALVKKSVIDLDTIGLDILLPEYTNKCNHKYAYSLALDMEPYKNPASLSVHTLKFSLLNHESDLLTHCKLFLE